MLYRYVTDTRNSTGCKESTKANLENDDNDVTSFCILFKALYRLLWIPHDRIVGHEVQNGCHVILIHEELCHWQIVIEAQ